MFLSNEIQKNRNRSQMEVAFQHLEAHMFFICPECGELYKNQQHWRQHLNYHHDYLCKTPEDFGFVEMNDRYHECTTCKAMVADGKRAIALLQYHRFLHLPYSRTYRCRHCTASFTRKRVLCEHLCRNHEQLVGCGLEKLEALTKGPMSTNSNDPNGNTNSLNSQISESIKNLVANSAKENPEFYIRYICPQCGKQLDDYKKWMMHIKMVHSQAVRSDCEMQRVSGTKNYYCKICRKVIFSSDSARLQRHYFSHMPYKVSFQCTFCKVRRAYKTELLHHFIRTHIKEFETQRKYVRKPIEWGAETNEMLDKELDLLLEYGSGVSSIKGPNSMKFTSTTVSNCYSRTMPKSFKTASTTSKRNTDSVSRKIDDYFRENSAGQSTKNKRSREEMNSEEVQQTNIKRNPQTKSGLDALCAEIFGDLDMEAEQIEQSNENIEMSLRNRKSKKDSNDITESNHGEVVSIEINPLDESEISQLEGTESDQSEDVPLLKKRPKLSDSVEALPSTSVKSKNYPTLKLLFNAKILHLCPKCGKSFGEHSVWRDHVLSAHENLSKMLEDHFKEIENEGSNMCLKCMEILPTTNKSELQRHCFTHMPFHAYLKCTLCGTSKTNKSKMMLHLETEHGSLLQKDTNTSQSSTEHSVKNIKQAKGGIFHLMKHLVKANERLNRLAAGIE